MSTSFEQFVQRNRYSKLSKGRFSLLMTFIVLFMLMVLTFNQHNMPGFETHLVSLEGITNSGESLTFLVAFINSHPDIAKIAIALSGHTIFFRQYTAFTATIDNPGSGDSANIMISNNGDGDFTIFSLQYTILIVESIAASYIDVVMSDYFCHVLNIVEDPNDPNPPSGGGLARLLVPLTPVLPSISLALQTTTLRAFGVNSESFNVTTAFGTNSLILGMVLTSFDVNLASNLLEINLNGANLLYTISITSQMTMTRVSYTVISLNNSALSSSGITYLTNLFSFQSNQILTFPSSMTNIDQICLVGFFSLTSFSPSFSIRSQIVSNNFTFTSSTNYFQYLKYFCLGQCNVPREFANNPYCQPCSSISNCLECTSSTVCTRCAESFAVNSTSQCQQCEQMLYGCSTCNNSFTCLTCVNNTFALNPSNTCSFCQTLMTNCATCNDKSTCLTCINISFAINSTNKCEACSILLDNCLACSNNLTCLTCVNESYAVNTTSYKCELCNMLLMNCSTCNKMACIQCETHSYNKNGLCYPCTRLANCSDCTNDGVCTACLPLTYIDMFTVNTSCSSCDIAHCVGCVDGPLCINCEYGYFLPNGTALAYCKKCQTPCENCHTNETNCMSCISKEYYYVSTNNSCALCKDSIPNCHLCSSSTFCRICESNEFYVDILTRKCVACNSTLSNCTNCANSVNCLRCSDLTLHILAGKCEPCSTSMPGCLECLSASYCILCNNLTVLAPDSSECVQCPISNCLNCSRGPKCLECNDTYYLNHINFLCYLCPPECETCTNQTYCLNCTAKMFINDSNVCIQCSKKYPNCLSCNETECEECENNYENKNNTCVEKKKIVCGDFVVDQSETCDLGLGVDLDGCTDECTVDDNFVCVNVLNGTVNNSDCRYTGIIAVALNYVNKALLQNEITVHFNVTPYIYGLEKLNSIITQFVEVEYKTAESLPQVSSTGSNNNKETNSQTRRLSADQPFNYTAEFANNELLVPINYSSHINNFEFLVGLSFNNSLPEFSSIPISTATFNLSKSYPNSLIGVYFSPSQAMQSQIISILSLLIGGLAVFLFFAAMFTKQISGLEFVLLVQSAYLSLLYYGGALSLPFYCLRNLSLSTLSLPVYWAFAPYATETDNLQIDNFGMSKEYFFNNFSYTALLWLLPIIVGLIWLPFKLKWIRVRKWYEFGVKAVELCFGEIFLQITIFNLQSLIIFSVIYYSSAEADFADYLSETTIFFALLCTVFSIIGFHLRPDFYEMFRKSFQHGDELTHDDDTNRTDENRQKNCEKLTKSVNSISIRKSYFPLHKKLSYNHESLYLFILITSIGLMAGLQIVDENVVSCGVVISLQCLYFLYLLVIRPYGSVSNKVRSIYYAFISICITGLRFGHNIGESSLPQNSELDYAFADILLFLLFAGLMFPLVQVIREFIQFVKELFSKKKEVVKELFRDEDIIPKLKSSQREQPNGHLSAEEEDERKRSEEVDRLFELYRPLNPKRKLDIFPTNVKRPEIDFRKVVGSGYFKRFEQRLFGNSNECEIASHDNPLFNGGKNEEVENCNENVDGQDTSDLKLTTETNAEQHASLSGERNAEIYHLEPFVKDFGKIDDVELQNEILLEERKHVEYLKATQFIRERGPIDYDLVNNHFDRKNKESDI